MLSFLCLSILKNHSSDFVLSSELCGTFFYFGFNFSRVFLRVYFTKSCLFIVFHGFLLCVVD